MKLVHCMAPHCQRWAPVSSRLCLAHFQALPRPLFRLMLAMRAGAETAETPERRRYCQEQYWAYRRQAIARLSDPGQRRPVPGSHEARP